MDFTIYCDESRHDGAAQNSHMSIGGLWLPSERKKDLTKELRRLMREQNLNAEVKWSKVSAQRLDAYKALIDFFFANEELCFRVIVIDQKKVNYDEFHGGDRELGFYKFYYQMLEKWLTQGNQYLILLDFKKNKGANRFTSLRTFLERKTKGHAWIKDLTVINSAESPLAQLADLLTGAVAADWCGISEGTAKQQLAAYIAQKQQRPHLRFETASPAVCKFNVFPIRL